MDDDTVSLFADPHLYEFTLFDGSSTVVDAGTLTVLKSANSMPAQLYGSDLEPTLFIMGQGDHAYSSFDSDFYDVTAASTIHGYTAESKFQ